jgi:translation initiation factor 3 subunit I
MSHSEKAHPILRIPITGPKVTSMLWGTLDKTIITGHENGELTQWDLRVSMIMLKCM